MAAKKLFKTEEEILDLLERVFKVGSTLKFSQVDGRSIKATWSLVKNINYHTFDMAMRPESDLEAFGFKEGQDLIVQNESGSISFKTQISSINHKNLIVVKVPSELKLIDTRSARRYELEDYKVELTFTNHSLINYSHRHELIPGILIDISENGLSLETEKNEKYEYHLGDKLKIQSLNRYSPSIDISGEVVFLKEVGESYKIGLKFHKIIPTNETLKYLRNRWYIQSDSDEE